MKLLSNLKLQPMKFIIASFFFCIAFIACSKEEEVLDTRVTYTISSCCNFWEDESDICNSNDRKENAACFLDNENITFSQLEIVQGGPICVCIHCCGCCTGESLKLKTNPENLTKLQELGFELE